MKRDVIIITAMLLSIGLGIRFIAVASLRFVKVGYVVAVVLVCLGLANFGWEPLFGGSHPLMTYFGSITLFMGLLGGAILASIDEGIQRITDEPDPRPGFPILLKSNKSSDPTIQGSDEMK